MRSERTICANVKPNKMNMNPVTLYIARLSLLKRPQKLFVLKIVTKINHSVYMCLRSPVCNLLCPFLRKGGECEIETLFFDGFESQTNDMILWPQRTLTPNFIKKICRVLRTLSQNRRTHADRQTNKCPFSTK